MGRFWLSVFGAGYSPWAPGTCGSLVVTVLFILLALLHLPLTLLAWVMVLVALHGAAVTVIYGDAAIAQLGPDPGLIVSDEQCGQALTYLALFWLAPTFAGSFSALLTFAGAGFVLFRLLDIIKPPPARQLEHIPGAWGVLLDDVAAGIYAAVILLLAYHFGLFDCLSH